MARYLECGVAASAESKSASPKQAARLNQRRHLNKCVAYRAASRDVPGEYLRDECVAGAR